MDARSAITATIRSVLGGGFHHTATALADEIVETLDEGNLLVTPEIQAVLDSATKWNAWADGEWTQDHADLMSAVDAYLLSK